MTDRGVIGRISSDRDVSKVCKSILVIAILVSSALLLVLPTSAAYAAKDIGWIGYDYTNPTGINDDDQISASRWNDGAPCQSQAIVYDRGTSEWSLLPDPGGFGEAHAINNNGEVVGAGAVSLGPTSTGELKATFWTASHTMVNLKPVTGGDYSDALGVNDFRVTVGVSESPIGDEKWSFTTGGALYSSPAVVYGRVYIGSDDGKVYALDASTGAFLWSYTTGSSVYSSPAVADGKVYVGSYDGNVYALDAYTGALVWSYTTGALVDSSPAVANGKVYIGSNDGNVYALDAYTGVCVWSYMTGGFVYSSPTVVDGVVYVGSYDCNVYALDAYTGAFKWSYTTDAPVDSRPAVANSVVYFGSGDWRVYALYASSGALKWSYLTGGPHPSTLVVDDMVYVGSWEGKVYALNAADGSVAWSYTTGGTASSPAVANGRVYVGSRDHNVYALSAADGSLVWSHATSSFDGSPTVVNDVVYVGSGDGKVYAFDDRPKALVAVQWSVNLPAVDANAKVIGRISGLDIAEAVDINGHNNVVGNAYNYGANPIQRHQAFYWDGLLGSPLILLDPLVGGSDPVAEAISDSGLIVGSSKDSSGHLHAVVWTSPTSTPIDLGAMVGEPSEAYDVNDDQKIVGFSYPTGVGFVFDFNLNTCEYLGSPPGGSLLAPKAINRNGHIASGCRIISTSEYHTFLLTPNTPPEATFTSEWIGELTVRLDASASFDPDGTIAIYSWAFGDGSKSTGMIATHTYAAPGSYEVTLTVTDDYGESTSVSQPLDGADVPVKKVMELIEMVDSSPYIDPEAKGRLKGKLAVAKHMLEARSIHGADDIGARSIHGESAANVLQVFDDMLVEYTVILQITDPEVGWDLTMESNLIAALLANKVLMEGLPCYKWYGGCGPTAAGMMIGYWDSHGFPDLVKGTDDAITQSSWVNAMIASPEHIADYALYPEDPSDPNSRTDDSNGDIIRDKSELGGAHQDNCLADFMQTSWSQFGFRYGQSPSTNVPKALEDYASYANPQYVGVAKQVPAGSLKWKDLKYQIDTGHPMALTVDIDGDRATDHLVAVVGYCEIGSANMYAFYSTWDCSIWFGNFESMDVDVYFGVWSGFTFDISLAPS